MHKQKLSLKITLHLVQAIYQTPLVLRKLLSFRDRVLYHYQKLAGSPIYNFLTLLVNALNICAIAFGDQILDEELQLRLLDICFLLFLCDFCVKLLANTGMQLYLQDIYNFFDLLCLLCYAFNKALQSMRYVDNFLKSSRFLTAIQPLRAFRLLKYFSFMKTIQLVISKTFSDYLPLAIILFVFLYIFTLFGLQLFNTLSFTDHNSQNSLNFRDFFQGFATCFSILTLDNWYTFLVLYMPQSNTASIVPFTLTLFLFGNFIVLDLFIAAMLHGFEFICLKQIPQELEQSKENRHLSIVTEKKKSIEKKKSSNLEFYLKMTRIMTVFSLYWRLKRERILKFLNKFSSHLIFNKLVYMMIWFSCLEIIYESYHLHYWNYESEIGGLFFTLNSVINLFFTFEITLKMYTQGINRKNLAKNLLKFTEIIYISGFFAYFMFTEKNLLIQVKIKSLLINKINRSH